MSNDWRVVVTPDAGVDGVVLQVVERVHGTGVLLHHFAAGDAELLPEGVAALRPSLTLPDPLAHALLDALAEHYGGVASTRTMRADFLHERARVDRLIEVLATRGVPRVDHLLDVLITRGLSGER